MRIGQARLTKHGGQGDVWHTGVPKVESKVCSKSPHNSRKYIRGRKKIFGDLGDMGAEEFDRNNKTRLKLVVTQQRHNTTVVGLGCTVQKPGGMVKIYYSFISHYFRLPLLLFIKSNPGFKLVPTLSFSPITLLHLA